MSFDDKLDVVRRFFMKSGISVQEQKGDEYCLFYGSYEIDKEMKSALIFRLILENAGPWLRIIVTFPTSELRMDRLLAVSEFLSRVNFRLTFGRFEMNFANGQVRFTSCQDACVLESKESAHILDRQVMRAIAISYRFYPCLKRVWGGESPLNVSAEFRNERR